MARGRKPKVTITPEITKVICEGIEAGMSKKAAMDGIVAEPTFYTYMRIGEDDVNKGKDSDYAHFFKCVKEAERKFITRNLNVIQKATAESWSAAAWLLERRFPDEYGRNRLEITGKDGEPVQTESAVKIYLPDNGRDK